MDINQTLIEADQYAIKNVGQAIDQDHGGSCGFAWVSIKGIRKKAFKETLHQFGFNPAYQIGLSLWVTYYGQSINEKERYAHYFAQYMREITGLDFKSGSRID